MKKKEVLRRKADVQDFLLKAGNLADSEQEDGKIFHRFRGYSTVFHQSAGINPAIVNPL